MRTAQLLLAVILLAVAARGGKPKKPRPVASGPVAQSFAVPCAKIWPYMMRTMVKMGFRPTTSDREGGVASFDSTKGMVEAWFGDVHSEIDEVAVGRGPAFLNEWKRFKIDSATLTVLDTDSGGCTVEATVTFSGYNQRFLLPKGWQILESKGVVERRILDGIVGAMPAGKAEPRADAAKETAPASVAPTPAPPPAPTPTPRPREPEPDAGTHVVRLPG